MVGSIADDPVHSFALVDVEEIEGRFEFLAVKSRARPCVARIRSKSRQNTFAGSLSMLTQELHATPPTHASLT